MKKVIFVIDDSETDFILAKKIFLAFNSDIELKHFISGESAIRAIEEIEDEKDLPKYIFVDLEMPVMDGFEFLDELESKNLIKDFEVIMLTHSRYLADIESFDKQKISREFIRKPLKVEDISRILEGEY